MIESLKIQNVRQSATDEDRIFIYFTIQDYCYYLFLQQNDEGIFIPKRIDHFTNDKCPLCHSHYKYMKDCSILDDHNNELFQRLIEYPSIRLEWLFLNKTTSQKE